MDDITIRPATADDLDRLIAILYDDPPSEFRGLVPDRRKARAIGAAMLRTGLSLNVGRTAVAVAGGEAVGLIELHRPGDSDRLPLWPMLRIVARALPIVGPGGLWRYVSYQRARGRMSMPHPPQALYVWELDVHPDWRNRGIGSVMLRHAEEVARREGFPRIALSTTTTNPAQHLYHRHGYRIVETRLDPAYERLTGIPGRVLMVKELG